MTIEEINKLKEATQIFKNYAFSNEQIRLIISACREEVLSVEQIEVFAKPKFDDKQMKAIMYAFKIDVPIDIVVRYADLRYDDSLMIRIFEDYSLRGLTTEEIDEYLEYWNTEEWRFRRYRVLEKKHERNKKEIMKMIKVVEN